LGENRKPQTWRRHTTQPKKAKNPGGERSKGTETLSLGVGEGEERAPVQKVGWKRRREVIVTYRGPIYLQQRVGDR